MNMYKTKYSFLLAAWKTAFLEQTIKSILNQTYKDFTLIISDDCSPDNIKSIVDQFKDERIEYKRNEKNIGGYNLVDHWNLQLQRDAQSDYVIMASDDDVYDEHFLEKIDELTLKYPQVDLLRARCCNTDAKGVVNFVDDPSDEYQTELHFAADLYNGRHIRSFANFVFKTETLKQKGGFINFPYAWYADAVSTLMMAENGVAHTIQPLFSYRGSGLAISGTRKDKTVCRGKMKAALMNYKWMNNYIKKMKFTQNSCNINLYNALIRNFRHDSYATMISYFWAFSFFEKVKIYKQIREGAFFSKPSFGKELFIFYMGKFA